jgi:hypothetical protein
MRSLRSGCFVLVLSAIAPVASAEPTAGATATQATAPSQAAPPQPYPTAPYPYAPAYPPSPQGPQAYPQYCPACPLGTACMNGLCVPVYPLPCPPGMVLDATRTCVPVGSASDPYASNRETPAEAKARAAREERRLHSRLTIDLELSIGLMGDAPDPVIAPAFTLMAGYRRNFVPWFGLILRGGPLIGVATYQDSSSTYSSSSYNSGSNPTDSTTMMGAIVEALPYFGPFGRIYVAPSFSVLYLWFNSYDLQSGSHDVRLDSAATMAMGFQLGWVLGDSERTVLSFGGRFATLNTVTLLFTFGVGFQIF